MQQQQESERQLDESGVETGRENSPQDSSAEQMGEGPETLRIDHGEEKTQDDSAGKTAEIANKSDSPDQVKDDEDSMNQNFFIKPSTNTSKPIMRLDVIQ